MSQNKLRGENAKIVATLGPGSRSRREIRALAEAGVDVFRLNFSHGEHEAHREALEAVRAAETALGQPLATLADLQGPKVRVGRFVGGTLRLGFRAEYELIAAEETDRDDVIPVPHAEIVSMLEAGDTILVDDGKLILTVTHAGDRPRVRSEVPGKLGDKKGFTVRGKALPVQALTDKDRRDLAFALEIGVDIVALSFVQTVEDVLEAKAIIAGRAPLVAKLEKPAAITNLLAIVEAADAVMVARGDLGVEFAPEDVPVIQRRIVRAARAAGRPVIVATQMLESMITNSRPTRAEVTDVSLAVERGADAVMLSGETAVGEFAEEAVRVMHRVARQTEAHMWADNAWEVGPEHSDQAIPIWNVIANATAQISRQLMTSGVMVITRGGTSAATVSTARPAAPIVAITNDPRALQRMSLLWGVIPVLDESTGTENPNEVARRWAEALGLAEVNDSVVLVRGFHEQAGLNTPSITVINVRPD